MSSWTLILTEHLIELVFGLGVENLESRPSYGEGIDDGIVRQQGCARFSGGSQYSTNWAEMLPRRRLELQSVGLTLEASMLLN